MKHKSLLKLSACLLLAVLMLNGCETKNTTTKQDLFQYKGSYVGDGSAVGNILNHLPVTGYSKDYELQTAQAPYGIILNYDGSETKQERQKIIIYTATYLFTLIRNVDWITYNFDGQEYKLTKQTLQQWYNNDLTGIQNEDDIKSLINSQVNNLDKVEQLIKQ